MVEVAQMPRLFDLPQEPSLIKQEFNHTYPSPYFTAEFRSAVRNATLQARLGRSDRTLPNCDKLRQESQESPSHKAPSPSRCTVKRDSLGCEPKHVRKKRKLDVDQTAWSAGCEDNQCKATISSVDGNNNIAEDDNNSLNELNTKIHVALLEASAKSSQRSHANQKSSPGKGRSGGGQKSRGGGGGKRKREASDQGDRSKRDGHSSDDPNDLDENDASDVAPEPSTKLLACQFNKKDPLKFRGPGKFKACQNGFDGFNRLKQHLRTVHQPKSYCMGCESVFECQDEKDNHDRNRGECEARRLETKPSIFDEMITNDRQREALKRKLVSVSTSSHWFDMWRCLHGDVPQPASPYKESSLDAADFVSFAKRRAVDHAQDYMANANPNLPLAQLLANFGHVLLERAAAEYLQNSKPNSARPSPLTAHVQNFAPEVEVGRFHLPISEPQAVEQFSPAIDFPVMSPSLSSNLQNPTIVVTDEGQDLGVDNNAWNPNDLNFWIVEDPMLGNKYISGNMTWIPPSHESMDSVNYP